jgi:predicted RNase H-like HicB family nuclease
MQYHYKTHREGSGFWGYCLELDGAPTQGDTWEEFEHNMSESLSLYLDEREDSDVLFPEPNPSLKGRNIVKVPVDPKVALAMLVRQARVKRKLTQKQASEKLGMKNVYSYQRLESSNTANPEFTTLLRLKALFPELSVDLAMG